MNAGFWVGRSVLVTGHTGFKGGWLSLWLARLGAEVHGFALDPNTHPALFKSINLGECLLDTRGDLRDPEAVDAAFDSAQPEIVFHLGAQAIVRAGYQDPVGTFATNLMGTVNVLEAARRCDSVRGLLVVTSDKCYLNAEAGEPFREDDPLGGSDPYSASKACAEIATAAYRTSFLDESRIAVATARAGNVLGGGDWSADRLIPDAVRAWQHGLPVRLRSPGATRPWQHVLTPIRGCLQLAQGLVQDPASHRGAWNLGPPGDAVRSVEDVIAAAASAWGTEAKWELDPGPHPDEARRLALDSRKAVSGFGFATPWDFNRSLSETIRWYQQFFAGASMREVCIQQIESFTRDSSN